jgi:ABC-type branched-subunit amino acid transport system substrate-binding protein
LLAAKPKKDRRPVALLLPLTGPRAALGVSMERAARLAENDAALMIAFDTAGTAEGASRAAALAVKRGAAMLLGPLTMYEAAAAAGAAPGVPMIAFTNNPAAALNGAYVFGLTAQQTTSAVLRYARSRGVKSVVVVGDGTAWGTAASDSASRLQNELGLDIRSVTVVPGQPLPAAGDPPDAVLVPGTQATVIAAARGLKETGIQLLGTVQALDNRPSALEALEGAWIASPDPEKFGSFSADYEAKNGGGAGALAALAFDAAGIAKRLRADNRLGREGLLGTESFACVTGAARFRTDGSVARDLAILVAERDGYRTVATSRGA